MKKILIILILILYPLAIGYSNDDTALIKRKILILPFINKNKIAEYDYLSGIIMETLRSELMETNKYLFTNFILTRDELKNKGYKQEDFIDLKIAKEIAQQLNADVVITGQYIIFERKILILIHTIDLLTGELVALTKAEGSIGVELFDVINKASVDMTEKIMEKLPMIEKNEYDKKTAKNKKFILTPMKKAGIGLLACGSTLIAVGVPILIYDIAGYSQSVRTDLQNYRDTNSDYAKYDTSYNIFVGLLISSICTAGLGVILAGIGLPLILINLNKNKDNKNNISFLITAGNPEQDREYRLSFLMRIRL